MPRRSMGYRHTVFQPMLPEDLREKLLANAQLGTFKSGLGTAGKHNKNKKSVSVADDATLQELSNYTIGEALAAQAVGDFAFVRRISIPNYYRYDVGDHYDVHLDRPISYGIRTDITYT